MGEAASRGPVASVVLASAYSLWSTLHTVTMAASGRLDRPSSCVSLRLLLKEFPVLCARAVRSWNLVHYFFVSLLLAVLVPGVWVLLMSSKIGFFGRRLSSWVQCLVQQWIHVLRQYSGDFGRIYTFSTWWQTRSLKLCFSIRFEWRSVPSRCFGCSLLSAVRFWKHWTSFYEFHGLSCMMMDGFSLLSAAFFRPPPS